MPNGTRKYISNLCHLSGVCSQIVYCCFTVQSPLLSARFPDARPHNICRSTPHGCRSYISQKYYTAHRYPLQGDTLMNVGMWLPYIPMPKGRGFTARLLRGALQIKHSSFKLIPSIQPRFCFTVPHRMMHSKGQWQNCAVGHVSEKRLSRPLVGLQYILDSRIKNSHANSVGVF